jgi:hypothetical protein
VDFTGGISEKFNLRSESFLAAHPTETDLYRLLQRTDGRCLVGCSGFKGNEGSTGLVENHAFTVTAVRRSCCPTGRALPRCRRCRPGQ